MAMSIEPYCLNKASHSSQSKFASYSLYSLFILLLNSWFGAADTVAAPLEASGTTIDAADDSLVDDGMKENEF